MFLSERDTSKIEEKINEAFEPLGEIPETLKDKPEWVKLESLEKVHIRPAMNDKFKMLVLNTHDKDLYRIFNETASVFTEQWSGFNQIGWEDDQGITAWELKGKIEITDQELLEAFKAAMLAEAKMHG